jgi:hypothetical protein
MGEKYKNLYVFFKICNVFVNKSPLSSELNIFMTKTGGDIIGQQDEIINFECR